MQTQNVVSKSQLRSRFSDYLNQLDHSNAPLVFGERKQKEYVIFQYPNDDNLLVLQRKRQDYVSNTEYYTTIGGLYSERENDIHDDLIRKN